MKLASPSKINLFLRVLKKRPDGYHELASLFQAIDLCDFLDIELAERDCLTCSNPYLPLDSSNLVNRALALFRSKTGIHQPVRIHLDKHIPIQAGLGGGSGNAATTLWGLNELLGKPADISQLILWSSEIGSDIPFFFSQGTAYCTGRGESIRHLDCLPPTALWIVKPFKGLSTHQVFSKLDIQDLISRDPEKHLNQFQTHKGECFNDLEVPAFRLLPELFNLKTQLKSIGFKEVILCGSGSSFFCLGDSSMPSLSDAVTFRARFLNRTPNSWFTFPSL